jgi:hypothetical protein
MVARPRTGQPGPRRTSAGTLLIALVLAVSAQLGQIAPVAQARTVWLCRPGLARDPCEASRTATVVSYEGTIRREALQPQVSHGVPPIDCFYAYPTVSTQPGPNANLKIEPQETRVAVAQASRFSEDCRVYAPMYPQVTLDAIRKPLAASPLAAFKAYLGILEAWQEYLHKYNKGRGFVLIGHSQGALVLIQLIKEQIDTNKALRKRLVSAILLGGNVLVPRGRTVGGSFRHVPACQWAAATGCVIAYSSFAKEPPPGAYFGRPGSPLLEAHGAPAGTHVLCVNPTLRTQDGGAGALLPYAPTTSLRAQPVAGPAAPQTLVPWVEEKDLATAQCEHRNGASWLQISTTAASEAVLQERTALGEVPTEALGPDWGLHLDDVNEALGNLVSAVASEGTTYVERSEKPNSRSQKRDTAPARLDGRVTRADRSRTRRWPAQLT